MTHSEPERLHQEDQEPVERDQQPETDSRILEVNFHDLQNQTVEVVEKEAVDDDVALVKAFFQEKLEKVKKDLETTKDEREKKHLLLRSLLTQLKAKKKHWEENGKTADELEPFEGLIREVSELISGLERKMALVDDVRKGLTRRLKLAEIEDGEQKKETIEKIIKVMSEAPKRLKDRGVHESDLRDLMEEAKKEINRVDLEKLRKVYEEILDARKNDASPRILHFRLVSLVNELVALPESEELLEKVRELKAEVDAEMNVQDERNQQVAKEVRPVGAKVRLFFREASRAKKDKKEREKNIVEAIRLLQEEVFDDEGNLDSEKVSALRFQFEGAQDAAYRIILLNWVINNPGVEITVGNLDQIMKNLPDNDGEENGATSEEKYEKFNVQRKKIMDLEEDPGQRFHRLTELLQKIRNANARDRNFADEYGDDLLRDIGEEWSKCKKILHDSLSELKLEEKDQPDDSKAVIQRFRNANDAESLNLEDTSVLAQLVEGTFTHEKESHGGSNNLDGSGEVVSDDEHIERRAESDESPEVEKVGISRRARWVSAAVVALLTGIWALRDSKETQVNGGDPVPLDSSIPFIDPEPESNTPSIAEQAEKALRILEERRSIYERDLSEVSQLHTRVEKINRLKELLAALALDPDREFFGGLHDRLTRLLQQYEEEERIERLAITRSQFEQRFREIQGLQNNRDKKLALERLATDLSSEPLPGYPDLQNLVSEEIRRIESLLLRAEREAEFENRLSDIEALSNDEVKRERIIALESELSPLPPQTEPEFPELLERAREVKRETEQRLEMAARRTQFAQRIEQATSLATDEEKKAALEELIAALTETSENNDLLDRAREELREVESRLAARPVAPEVPPIEPEREAHSDPLIADQLRQERSDIAGSITATLARISEVEREIQQWRNHLVIEHAQRRRAVLREKGEELSRLQSELQTWQQRDEMLARVISLQTKNQQLDRIIELKQHILPDLSEELRQTQSSLQRLEDLRVRTPGENAALQRENALRLRQQAVLHLHQEEVRLLGRRVLEYQEE